MLLRDFTQAEYDYCVERCHFTDDELKYFDLKVQGNEHSGTRTCYDDSSVCCRGHRGS